MKKKTKNEWDRFQLEAQGFEQVHQPLLVKFTTNKLLRIIYIPKWNVGFIFYNVFSQIEKDDDLVENIWMNMVGYAKPLRFVWDARNWNSESTNSKKKKEM
jgi:hypothetical protein